MNKEKPDCSLSVMGMCQEGMTMVKNFKVEFNDSTKFIATVVIFVTCMFLLTQILCTVIYPKPL